MGPPPASAVDWAGVVLLCGCAVLAALLDLFLVPFYVGSQIVPVAVLLTIAGNFVLPALAYLLVPRTFAAALPLLIWALVVIVVGLIPRPEGDVVLPGGNNGVVWVGYGVLFGGVVAGGVTVAWLASRPVPARSGDDRRRASG